MKMKVISTVLIVAMVGVMFAGCTGSSKSTVKTDYVDNIDDYVTLGEYKGLTYTPDDTEVTDDEVEQEIEAYLESYADNEQITEGEVTDGCTVNIDYVGYVDGVAFDGGTGNYDLTIGSGSFIDGFEDALIGMKVGETRTIDVTFPENYSSEDLAGKPATFDVTANYLLGDEIIPELDDDFVKENTDYENVDDYREYVRGYLENAKLQNAEDNAQSALWQQVVENCTFADELPQDKIDEAKETLTSQYEYYASMYGMEMSDFIEAMGMTEDSFNEQVEESAVSGVKSNLAFYAIVEKEGLTCTEDEISEHAQEIADTYGYESADAVIESAGEDAVADDLLWNKAMDIIVSSAKAE